MCLFGKCGKHCKHEHVGLVQRLDRSGPSSKTCFLTPSQAKDSGRAGPVSYIDMINALSDAFVCWRCHWVLFPCAWEQGSFLEKNVPCVSTQVYLFIYLFYIMINCTVFWENEIVHVKIKEPQSGRTQYRKQLEHLKIKGRNRNDEEF